MQHVFLCNKVVNNRAPSHRLGVSLLRENTNIFSNVSYLCILHICVYKIYNSTTLFKGKISYKILIWSLSSLPSKALTIFIYFELINVFGIMRSCLFHNDFHSCLFLYSCMFQGSGGHVSCISMYRNICDFLHVRLTICMQLFGTRYPCTRSTFSNRMLSAEEP